MNPLLFDTHCLKNNWVFQKNYWVNTPKSSLSVSLKKCPTWSYETGKAKNSVRA